MESLHRLSMNTSLKNARIFDDDAWDENNCPIPRTPTKQEPEDSIYDQSVGSSWMHNSSELGNIKEEEPDDYTDGFSNSSDDPFEENYITDGLYNKSVKQEMEDTKSSPAHDRSIEEGELEDSSEDSSEDTDELHQKVPTPPPPPKINSEAHIKQKTPPQLKVKFEPVAPVDGKFDESPYNKELFKTLKIKEETPVKPENGESIIRNSLKSAKRTVFSRHSPYKKVENELYERRVAVKSRLGPKTNIEDEDNEDMSRPNNRRRAMETDPIVISRREKQIEYGKNTKGYESYIKMVPRSERTRDDPQTPPKYRQYSRRGWEGLVKQWRIRLHKYDPPDNAPK